MEHIKGENDQGRLLKKCGVFFDLKVGIALLYLFASIVLHVIFAILWTPIRSWPETEIAFSILKIFLGGVVSVIIMIVGLLLVCIRRSMGFNLALVGVMITSFNYVFQPIPIWIGFSLGLAGCLLGVHTRKASAGNTCIQVTTRMTVAWMMLPTFGKLLSIMLAQYGSWIFFWELIGLRNGFLFIKTSLLFPLGIIILVLGFLLFFVALGQLVAGKLKGALIVESGFYRYVRHPQIGGLCFAFLGFVLLGPISLSDIASLITFFVLELLIADYEECRLTRQHGMVYEDYMKKTSFIFPKTRVFSSSKYLFRLLPRGNRVKVLIWIGLTALGVFLLFKVPFWNTYYLN